jgi:hypothetical protein
VDPENEQGLAENVRRKFPRNWDAKKSPGTPEFTAGLKLREAAKAFLNVSPAAAASKPSGRPGSRSAWIFLRGPIVALVAAAAGITLS